MRYGTFFGQQGDGVQNDAGGIRTVPINILWNVIGVSFLFSLAILGLQTDIGSPILSGKAYSSLSTRNSLPSGSLEKESLRISKTQKFSPDQYVENSIAEHAGRSAARPDMGNIRKDAIENTQGDVIMLPPSGDGPDESTNKTDSVAEEGTSSMNASYSFFFFLIDDMGYNDIGYQSVDLPHATPTMDRLASSGVTLTSYYTIPSCTPTRAALMTGKYPHNIGMGCDGIGTFLINSKYGLPKKYKLLPGVLQDAGYSTHMIGKWNLGHYAEGYLPHNRGFSTFLGYNGDQETYYSHHAFGIMPVYNSTFCDFLYGDCNGMKVGNCYEGNYSTDIYTGRAIELLREHQNGSDPLFLYIAYQAVHAPLEEPPPMAYSAAQEEMLTSLQNVSGSWQRRTTYARMLMAVDDSVLQIVEELEDQSMLESSYIIVASDNGGCPSDGGSNYPLRGAKFTQFQGGVKVPAFIYSPLLSTFQGSTYDDIFHVTDWLPTIASFAGATSFIDGTLDGIDMAGALRNEVGAEKREQVILHFNSWSTPASGDEHLDSRAEIGNFSGMSAAIMVNNTWKLIMGEAVDKVYTPSQNCTGMICSLTPQTGLSLLFNIADDPSEDYDASQLFPEVFNNLSSILLNVYNSLDTDSAWRNADTEAYVAWADAGYYVIPWNDSSTS